MSGPSPVIAALPARPRSSPVQNCRRLSSSLAPELLPGRDDCSLIDAHSAPVPAPSVSAVHETWHGAFCHVIGVRICLNRPPERVGLHALNKGFRLLVGAWSITRRDKRIGILVDCGKMKLDQSRFGGSAASSIHQAASGTSWGTGTPASTLSSSDVDPRITGATPLAS